MQRVNRQGYYCVRCGVPITQEEYEKDNLCGTCRLEVFGDEE